MRHFGTGDIGQKFFGNMLDEQAAELESQLKDSLVAESGTNAAPILGFVIRTSMYCASVQGIFEQFGKQ